MIISFKQCPGLLFLSAVLALSSELAAGADIQRIIGPVKFSTDPAIAAIEAVKVRPVLEQFRKAGLGQALWVVERLPTNAAAIKSWANACLAAFPRPPVLALEATLAPGEVATAFMRRILPEVHSVVINYPHFDKLESAIAAIPAPDTARANAGFIRKLSSKSFLWLFLSDDPAAAQHLVDRHTGQASEALASLLPLANGVLLHCVHSLSDMQQASFGEVQAMLVKAGKPSIIRSGFVYVAPRVRKGIEEELGRQYLEGIARYEQWVKESRYAGYARLIGPAIPANMDPNLSFAPQ